MTIDAARDALLTDARRRAERLLADADADAATRVAAARQEAAAMIDEARRRGEAEGRAAAEHAAADARSQARAELLAAQRAVYDAFCAEARAQALALRQAPDYQQLLDRLAAAARRDLGDAPDLELEYDPEGRGGVRATAGARFVDYSLPAMADRAIAAVGPRLRELWT